MAGPLDGIIRGLGFIIAFATVVVGLAVILAVPVLLLIFRILLWPATELTCGLASVLEWPSPATNLILWLCVSGAVLSRASCIGEFRFLFRRGRFSSGVALCIGGSAVVGLAQVVLLSTMPLACNILREASELGWLKQLFLLVLLCVSLSWLHRRPLRIRPSGHVLSQVFCPAKEAWAEGAGISDGRAGGTLEFVVHMKHHIVTKSPDLRVAISGVTTPIARVDLDADFLLARVEWSTARAGLYLVNVMIGSAPIRGSPFTVAVHAAEMCAAKSNRPDRIAQCHRRAPLRPHCIAKSVALFKRVLN